MPDAPPSKSGPEAEANVLGLDSEAMSSVLEGMAAFVPHNRALGMSFVERVGERVTLGLPYDAKLVGNPLTRVLHGGVITALMDATCGLAVFLKLHEPVPIATLDLRIDYLRPATPDKPVHARAECFKVTRNVAFVRCEAFHPDAEKDLVAVANGTFIVSRARDRLGEAAVNDLADAVRGAKETGNYTPLVEAIPYLGVVGFTLESIGGELLGKMPYAESLIGNPAIPAIHGGAIGGLLESTAIYAALLESETLLLPKIVTITIDYLRSGRPIDTFAKASITRQGRRVVNVSVEAWQEDRTRPIARANAIFLVEPG